MRLPPTKKDQTRNKYHFSNKGKGINMTHNVISHSHREHIHASEDFWVIVFLVLGIYVQVREAPFGWSQRCTSVVEGTPNSESKEQAHGMWKISKVIQSNSSFQNDCSSWRLKVQWVRGGLSVLRNDGQDTNGGVRHVWVFADQNYISDVTLNFYGRKHKTATKSTM